MKIYNDNPKTIIDIIDNFPTEQSCIDHLEKIRWNGNVISPFDASSKVWKCKGNKYQCKNTGKYFNVKTNTIYHGSRMPLCKWFCATFLMLNEPKVSSIKLGFYLGLTQKSAWFMMKRIKKANLYLDEKDLKKPQLDVLNKILKSNAINKVK